LTATAIALVLAAAFSHAGWNLVAKRLSGYDDVAYLWLVGVCSLALYAVPAAAVLIAERPYIGPTQLAFIAGSTLLHLAYFMLLQRGYRAGDLSLVYPLARGTGPMLSSLAAIVLLGERPGPLGAAGILLVGVGVIALGLPERARVDSLAAVGFGLATGLFIAGYTVWDKHAISALAIPPLFYNWAEEFGRVAALAPFALGPARRGTLRRLWADHRRDILACAVMMPLSYVLVLTAMRFTPVSAIAPAREVSVLIGVVLGGRLLAEGHLPRRLLAATAVAGGVIAIAVG
jgi:drug/metabolite transporter (DMT)-like permease